MTWAAKIPFAGVEPIIENLIAIVERDQTEALAWANGGSGLDDFEQISRARRADAKYPYLAIFASDTDLRQGDEERSLDQAHRIVMEIVVIGSDPEALTGTLHKYTKAVHQMVISASVADITEDLEASDAIWDVTRKEYSFERREVANGKYQLISRTLVQVRVVEA